MAIAEIRVKSLGELVDRVTPAQPDPETRRRRDCGVYRGMADTRWPLLTSLDQLGGTDPPHTKGDLEEHLLRNFIRYSRPHLNSPPANEWELLATAQHHGLPTRLLDWSYSPLVAAHFATANAVHDSDRVVWRLDWHRLHEHFKLPKLALLLEDLQTIFDQEQPFTPWRLFQSQTPSFACLIEPPSLNPRIVAQSAVFTLCSNREQSFDSFLSQQGLESLLTKFIIPAAEIGYVRDQLDLAGLDERLIFADLGGVAARMRRYYS